MKAIHMPPMDRLVLITLLALLTATAGCNNLVRGHGIRRYEIKQFDEADVRLSHMLTKNPTDWQALYYQGKVRLEQDRPLEAELMLEQALSIRHDYPETPQIIDALAEAMYRQGRTVTLYALLEDATINYGTSHDYIRQGNYTALSNDPDAAEVAFTKAAIFADPDDPKPYLAAADFYESINNIPKAKIALRRAYGLTPSDPVVINRLQQHGIVPGPTAILPVVHR